MYIYIWVYIYLNIHILYGDFSNTGGQGQRNELWDGGGYPDLAGFGVEGGPPCPGSSCACPFMQEAV